MKNCGAAHPQKAFVCVAPEGHKSGHAWKPLLEVLLRAATGPTLFSKVREAYPRRGADE